MKKLYFFITTSFILTNLYSQQARQNIELVKVGAHQFQVINKTTGLALNNLKWDEAESFLNGFAKVVKDHKWGFVDVAGNPAIPAKFEMLRNFSNHLAAARMNSKWGMIDEKGKTIIPFEYDILFDFKETVTGAYKNNKWVLLNCQGTVIRSLDVDIFYGFKNGIADIKRRGRSGKMNTKGEIISMEPAAETTVKNNPVTSSRPGAAQAEPCPDNIGFDRGNFTNWSCYTGVVDDVGGTTNVITVNPSPPTANRHVIYPRTNPSGLDPYGFFPINPPDGSGYALKLGNNVNGSEAERVSYQINVPANATDFSITYRYAVVFQDPDHERFQQPRLSAKILDVAENKYLPCSSFEFVAEDTIPGFFDSPLDPTIKCKSWTSVFINLSPYAGKTIRLEFTTADCTLGAHWGYCYLDIGDCNISADIQYQCNPNLANLTGPPGFRIYRWFNDDYSTRIGVGENVTLNPVPEGLSNIRLIVTPYSGGCGDTLHIPYKSPLPIADAGPDKEICLGAVTTIGTAPVAGNTYSWTPVTFLSNPNIASPSAAPTDTTTYALTVTKTADGCLAQDTVTVFVKPVPTALFDPGPDQCISENNFSFQNNSTGASVYDWTLGDGTTSNLLNPSRSYATAGPYPVKLVVENIHGCKDSVTHTINVRANPIITAVNDASICLGETVQLRASGGQTYEWSPAPGLSCTNCAAPVATPTVSTTWFVRGVSNDGCPGFDTVNVTVHQPIQVTVSPDRAICVGESVNLLASGADSYRWTPIQGLTSGTIPNPVATPAATTRYRVVGYDGHDCFTDTGYVNVTVNPRPTVQLGPDKTLLTGTIYPLAPVTTNGPIVSWEWSPATDLNCTTCPNPSATIKKDITYDVAVRNIYGCTAADTIHIKTFCENTQVFIPNAFTPDGDGINDVLMIRANGIEVVNSFRIFSRWGELLFEKTNFPPNSPTYGWDGIIKGKKGAPEVYVYTVEVTCDNLQTYTYKGNVSILK